MRFAIALSSLLRPARGPAERTSRDLALGSDVVSRASVPAETHGMGSFETTLGTDQALRAGPTGGTTGGSLFGRHVRQARSSSNDEQLAACFFRIAPALTYRVSLGYGRRSENAQMSHTRAALLERSREAIRTRVRPRFHGVSAGSVGPRQLLSGGRSRRILWITGQEEPDHHAVTEVDGDLGDVAVRIHGIDPDQILGVASGGRFRRERWR